MRIPMVFVLIAVVITVAIVLLAGSQIVSPNRPLLPKAEFSLDEISPNADGVEDITAFAYEITRNAYITMSFEDTESGDIYYFRENERRSANEYGVLFSGVVDGFTLLDENVAGEVMRRLIPNGTYTWTLTAVAQDDNETASITGALVVKDGDSPLPEMTTFEVAPSDFTPNQDGVTDRVMINVILTKEADLTVYLLNEANERIYVARREEGREEGDAGRHSFDYEGGVDIGADPPPDGTYTVVGEAQDAEGQITRQEATLTIRNGGKPRAEIMGQPDGVDVMFETMPYDDKYYSDIDGIGKLVEQPDAPHNLPITMPVGDLLVFKLTVHNYGPAPIRTAGPWPGTVYQQDQVAASLGAYEQSGAWRVGIQCDTSSQSYPWRWAIGTPDNLYTETDPTNGNVYYYLAPGERSVVWGAIRMIDLVETRNPQGCWAGLIHEDVEISLQNANVGRREVELANLSKDGDN